jgi:hypothetical protein
LISDVLNPGLTYSLGKFIVKLVHQGREYHGFPEGRGIQRLLRLLSMGVSLRKSAQVAKNILTIKKTGSSREDLTFELF